MFEFPFFQNYWRAKESPPCPLRETVTKSTAHNPQVPLVTLFFDQEIDRTIAVLSRRDDSLDVYFQCRVANSTATEKSPYYFELDGYIRENLSKIRRHRGFYPDSIVIAIGALEASDVAQKRHLSQRHREELRRRHKGGDSLETSHPGLLEVVLEVARLHRLADDLDVLSLHFMRQTSKTFRRIGSRIVGQKMSTLKVNLTPFVDGVNLSSFSTFTRAADAPTVRVKDADHVVEYHQLPDIEFGTPQQHESAIQGTMVPKDEEKAVFSWQCEEVALANLHRFYGDIVMRYYAGHKLVLVWHPDPADALLLKQAKAPIEALRMEPTPKAGRQLYRGCRSSALVDIVGESKVEYDVTFSYQGSARLQNVHVEFSSLLTIAADLVSRDLQSTYSQRSRERPLLDHESVFLKHLQRIAAC